MIGADAQRTRKQANRPLLVVLVVGETARAHNFQMNGYPRKNNPNLIKNKAIFFPHVFSCGTSTSVSVPCMFSKFDRIHYRTNEAAHYENLLDLLTRENIHILWRDNNTGCKGVCVRVPSENLFNLKIKPFCAKFGCYDRILLHHLSAYIDKHFSGDSMIVLHTLGSHGPDYFHRYPLMFNRYKPICDNRAVQECSRQKIINTYDNTILYTDYFLWQVIQLLKTYSNRYDTAMIYLSDHGESLGENSIYLHELPYIIAPERQKHIPFIIWLSSQYIRKHHINRDCLTKQTRHTYSQDNLFSIVLGLFQINTKLYHSEADVLEACRNES